MGTYRFNTRQAPYITVRTRPVASQLHTLIEPPKVKGVRLSRIRYLICMLFQQNNNYALPRRKLGLLVMKAASDFSYRNPQLDKYLLYSLENGVYNWYNKSLDQHIDALAEEGFLHTFQAGKYNASYYQLARHIPSVPVQKEWNAIVQAAVSTSMELNTSKEYQEWLAKQPIHKYYRKNKK